MDTQVQNFWRESIKKEAAVRFAWQLRYSKKFAKMVGGPEAQTQTLTPAKSKPQKQQLLESFTSSLSKRIDSVERQIPKEEVKTESRQPSRLSARLNKVTLSDMRPPSRHTQALLYNGISALGEGRYAYLKKRNKILPEKKFEFPVLSSCLYGWKIQERMEEPKKSSFARTCIIRDTFYKNSGVTIG